MAGFYTAALSKSQALHWPGLSPPSTMDKAARRRIEKAFGGKRALRAVEPMLDGYVVVAEGTILTVAHRTCRQKRDMNRRRDTP